ncbi:MAG: hypothetical protein H7A23_19150 [Leptospiraceae bacterium]|nr:hypothetical protein [Leptospiraceae bacterium]MCP5496672.1 hypothetical protein [Leptospiraceae bacterium]
MIQKILSLVMIALLLCFVACKKKDKEQTELDTDSSQSEKHHDHGMEAPPENSTQMKVVNGIKVVFDLMDKENHKKMVEIMGVDLKEDSKDDHYALLTLLNDSDSSYIKNAEVDIVINYPDGKKESKKATILDGANMYHYQIGFQESGKGIYKIQTKIKTTDKELNSESEFKL